MEEMTFTEIDSFAGNHSIRIVVFFQMCIYQIDNACAYLNISRAARQC